MKGMWLRITMGLIILILIVVVFWTSYSQGLLNSDNQEEIEEPETCETLDCSNSELGSFCSDAPLPAHCGCTLEIHCEHLGEEYWCGDDNKCTNE